jgi:hypothetical protein
MASLVSLLTFVQSDERYNSWEDHSLLIRLYRFLLILIFLTAVGLFLLRLDHLAGVASAAWLTNLGLLLWGYETFEPGAHTPFKQPFAHLGLGLLLWCSATLLLHLGPGVIRASRQTFFRAHMNETWKRKLLMIGGAVVVTIPLFSAMTVLLEPITLSEEYDFLFVFLYIICFFFPLLFICALGIAELSGPSRQDALSFRWWVLALVTIWILNYLMVVYSYEVYGSTQGY